MSTASPTKANASVENLRKMLEVAMRRASVGAAIRRAREEKRWKQKDLATAVHVEPQTISNWERSVSRPDFDMLEEVARATGKPLSYFVGDAAVDEASQDLATLVGQLAAAADRLASLIERLEAQAPSPKARTRAQG